MAATGGLVSKAVLDAINRPTADAISLPNAFYTRDEVLALERERLFFGGWTFVAVGAAVAHPGDVLPVTVAGLPALLARTRDGRLLAFHNVCSHRGTRLVSEPQRKKRVIVCPYHSWTYSLEGELRKTPEFNGPGTDEPAHFSKAAMGLKPIRCETWHDLVFLNASGDAPPLARTFAALDQRWSCYDLAELRYEGSATFDVDANWKLAIENFLESYHLPSAHPGLNSYSRMSDHYCMVEPDFLGQGSTQYNSASAGPGRLPAFPKLPKSRARMAEYPTFLPNLMLGIHPDHFFAFGVEPLGPERTRETFHFYFVGDGAMGEDLSEARRTTLERWKGINAEDISVVEGMQIGRHSPAYGVAARFSPYHEPTTHEFQRRVANALAG